ncbi:hypothetical protein [Flavisolibacter ginsenosidimutans]|uniref:Uncharacterized protein n=1 Tax=Flavisolibacter ginsenosidimutans TaxID=661481 RepID=A0A5B8UJK8_9BACT|nr:hypothetical protein [Flavisolibacter ginsenosidimutans]QEC56891.1 hypothetical protein FSB75_13625 [Flavisolibacter ginsenosidimutans]
MRTFLLFIGSVIYPVVMVIISPVLLFLYLLLGFVFLSRYVNTVRRQFLAMLTTVRLPLFHLPAKKVLAFRPKAVRLH